MIARIYIRICTAHDAEKGAKEQGLVPMVAANSNLEARKVFDQN
jgi:hypothetical protein